MRRFLGCGFGGATTIRGTSTSLGNRERPAGWMWLCLPRTVAVAVAVVMVMMMMKVVVAAAAAATTTQRAMPSGLAGFGVRANLCAHMCTLYGSLGWQKQSCLLLCSYHLFASVRKRARVFGRRLARLKLAASNLLLCSLGAHWPGKLARSVVRLAPAQRSQLAWVSRASSGRPTNQIWKLVPVTRAGQSLGRPVGFTRLRRPSQMSVEPKIRRRPSQMAD